MAVLPIKPSEVDGEKEFPDAVIEAFNELIRKNADKGVAVIKQDEVLVLIISKGKGLKRTEIMEKGWLDVEPMYRKAGWEVESSKPDPGESYEPYFVFKKKTKRKMK